MYRPYATAEDYHEMGFNAIPDYDLDAALVKASHQVDTLTFNRITEKFDKLSEFQKDVIQRVVCEQAEFNYENKDIMDTVISSYSINGVSMTFGDGFNILMQDGVPIQRTTYALLQQTGLCCRLAI